MIRAKITSQSKSALQNAAKKHVDQMEKKLPRALMVAGLFLQAESQKIVPVDKGFLRASAYTKVEKDNAGFYVSVGYRMHYAIYVHENLESWHAEGTQAKYLEQPFRENRDKLREIIKATLRA